MVNGENSHATEEQPIGTLKQNKNFPNGAIYLQQDLIDESNQCETHNIYGLPRWGNFQSNPFYQ